MSQRNDRNVLVPKCLVCEASGKFGTGDKMSIGHFSNSAELRCCQSMIWVKSKDVSPHRVHGQWNCDH